MATSNVVEYVFEGNTLELEAAIKKVQSLLLSSTQKLKRYQDGVITAEQKAQIDAVKSLTQIMKEAQKHINILTKDQIREVKAAGKEALRQASSIAKRASSIASKRKESIAASITPAALQKAKVQAEDLDLLTSVSGGTLIPEALKEIQTALKNYNDVINNANSKDAERAKVVQELNRVYKEYVVNLTRATKETQRAEKAQARKDEKEAKEAAKKAAEAAEEYEKLRELLTTAGQEQVRQSAEFLRAYAEELKYALSPEAYNDIINAVNTYEAAIKETDLTEEEQIEILKSVMDTYEQYAGTLRQAKRTQESFNKGIKTADDLIQRFGVHLRTTIQSVGFWIRMLRKLGQLIKTGIKDFADYVEALNFLQEASREASEEMKAFVDMQAQAFGLDPTNVSTAAAMFYSFADSMSFAREEATLISQNMTKLAQDIASLQNIDVELAAKKLRSALAGQARALATLGVNVNDANVQEWLYSKGLTVTMNKLNETSQAAARYVFILEHTAAAQGDLARTIESPANQFKILTAQLKLLVQFLGAQFLPLIMPIVRLLNNILRPIVAFLKALTSLSAEGYSDSIGEIGESFEDLGDDAEDANEAITGLTGLDEINQFSGKKKDPLGVGGINDDIELLLKGYDNLAEESNHLVQLFTAIGNAMAPLWAMFNNTTGISAITIAFDALGMVLTPVKWLFEGIGWLINQLPAPIGAVISILFELVSVFASVAAIIAVVKTLMQAKWVVTFAKSFVTLGKAMLGVVTRLGDLLLAAGKWFYETVILGIKNLWLSGTFWKVALGVIAAAGLAALAVAAVIGTATAIGRAHQRQAESSGSTPQLARGGIATGPTFAMIGEGKFNEAVIPLGNSPQFAAMKEDIAERVTYKITQQPSSIVQPRNNVPVILQVNGRELARAILPDLGITRPQTGVNLT